MQGNLFKLLFSPDEYFAGRQANQRVVRPMLVMSAIQLGLVFLPAIFNNIHLKSDVAASVVFLTLMTFWGKCLGSSMIVLLLLHITDAQHEGPTYHQIFAVMAYSNIVLFAGKLLGAACGALLFASGSQRFAFVPFVSANTLLHLAGLPVIPMLWHLDLFAVWSIAIAAAGIMSVAPIGLNKAVVISFLSWASLAWIRELYSLMFSHWVSL